MNTILRQIARIEGPEGRQPMKIVRTCGPRVARQVAAVYAHKVDSADTIATLDAAAATSVLGIPEDKFTVLLSHANQEQALKKADILAEALRSLPVMW
jgi:hypothetical protein